MRSYPVKENPIGSEVTEIIRYKQTYTQTDIHTNKHTSCYFIIRIYIISNAQLKFINEDVLFLFVVMIKHSA